MSPPLRSTARQIFAETLEQMQVGRVMRDRLHCAGGVLSIVESAVPAYTLNSFRQIRVISVGKAAVTMAAELVRLIEPAMTSATQLSGIVVGATPADSRFLRSFTGGHPTPDQQSLLAADAVLECLSTCGDDCLVLFLISGGASTMMERPLDPAMTIADTAAFHRVLVHSGLSIEEMNVLRKHFSAVKGGRLAVAAGSATQCTLLVSDVPDNALHIIGSGPTLPDPSTVRKCREILSRHTESLPFPEKITRYFLDSGLPETPKEGHHAFDRASWLALLSSADVCKAASKLAQSAGFHVVVDNSCDDWTYSAAADYLLQRMAGLRVTHDKVCLISVGEVLVKVDGQTTGVGGRNQHFVLECARLLQDRTDHVTVLSAGTDGIDGNSLAAGGVADELTVSRAAALGFSVSEALAQFDSNRVLDALGDTLVTGPTGTNVRDIRILLSAEHL